MGSLFSKSCKDCNVPSEYYRGRTNTEGTCRVPKYYEGHTDYNHRWENDCKCIL